MRSKLLCVALLCACKDPPKAIEDATPPPPAEASAKPVASTKPTVSAIITPPPSALPIGDGGGPCKLVAGPFALPYDGAAAIAIFPDGPRAVFNASGTPKLAPFAAGATPAEKTKDPACAVAGDVVFCSSPTGEIKRADKGEGGSIVAHARPGSPIGAALLGGKPIVSFIIVRKTTEGMITMAELWSEDGAQHFSDEGNGATWAFVAARESDVLGVFGDARMAMSPLHARVISGSGKPTIGPDTVLFVAGTSEPNTRGAIGHRTNGSSFALLPTARDLAFGVVSLRVDSVPKVDTTPVWSDYANGLDPAPLAATLEGPTVHVARVRPIDGKVNAPRILELGTLTDSGAFTSLGAIPTHGNVRYLAMTREKNGTLAIVYSDDAGTWAERHTCL